MDTPGGGWAGKIPGDSGGGPLPPQLGVGVAIAAFGPQLFRQVVFPLAVLQSLHNADQVGPVLGRSVLGDGFLPLLPDKTEKVVVNGPLVPILLLPAFDGGQIADGLLQGHKGQFSFSMGWLWIGEGVLPLHPHQDHPLSPLRHAVFRRVHHLVFQGVAQFPELPLDLGKQPSSIHAQQPGHIFKQKSPGPEQGQHPLIFQKQPGPAIHLPLAQGRIRLAGRAAQHQIHLLAVQSLPQHFPGHLADIPTEHLHLRIVEGVGPGDIRLNLIGRQDGEFLQLFKAVTQATHAGKQIHYIVLFRCHQSTNAVGQGASPCSPRAFSSFLSIFSRSSGNLPRTRRGRMSWKPSYSTSIFHSW